MKYLNFLAFLGLIGIVLGGGTSTCGQITTDFIQLLQISELKIERLLNFITCKYNNDKHVIKLVTHFFFESQS